MEGIKRMGFLIFFPTPRKNLSAFSFQLILQWQKGEFHTDLRVEKETILFFSSASMLDKLFFFWLVKILSK